MPTEAEAGGVLVKLVREQTTKEKKNKDRNLVSIEVEKAAMGLRKICHPKRRYPEQSSDSILVSANHYCFLGKAVNFHISV